MKKSAPMTALDRGAGQALTLMTVCAAMLIWSSAAKSKRIASFAGSAAPRGEFVVEQATRDAQTSIGPAMAAIEALQAAAQSSPLDLPV